MLQNLRDNLKGTVAVFVIIIFVVPLVLFGVEQLFVGSVSGTGAATVNGEEIGQRKLQRELQLEKQRRQQRFDLEPNSPQLEDSVLTGPVLQRMTRRLALQQAAKEGGMGASKNVLWKQIGEIEAFQTDGKLDYDLFKERISNLYTTSSFLEASASDLILNHINSGVTNSSFVTATEIEMLAAITKQERSFFSVKIPKESLADVEVEDTEVSAYYEANSNQFVAPETVTVEYLELNLDHLAADTKVSESDIKSAYEAEVSEFVADPKYKVAHILVKNGTEAEAKVKALTEKLNSDADFSVLAKEYSEDLGSKDNGGALGEMVAEAYHAKFVEAVKTLEVGGVSSAVKTDAGIHFIKLLEKSNVEAPTFAERKAQIARQLSKDLAREVFAQKMELLGEKTFNSDSLSQAADALSIEVKTSWPFERNSVSDISNSPEIGKSAFSDDVLKEGRNSRVIELPGDKAIVLRLKEHQPESIKSLALVKLQIRDQLKSDKQKALLTEKSSELLKKLSSGGDPELIAKEASYEYRFNENADRTNVDAGMAVVRKAFSLPRPVDASTPVYDTVSTVDGSYAVIGLLGVKDGNVTEIDKEQLIALKNQLRFQSTQVEMAALENAIVSRSKISIPK